MWVFAILLSLGGFAATINVCIPLDSNSVKSDSAIKDLLHDWKTISVNDSIFLEHIDLDLKHTAFRINGTLDHVLVSNLLDYDMCLLDVNISLPEPKFDVFNLTLHNVTIEGLYDIDGNVGDLFDIYGSGNFRLQLGELSVAMTHFNLSIGKELCFPINIDINIIRLKSNFENLMGDDELEELFNKAIETIGPEVLAIIWSEMKDIFDGPLEDAINDYFHNRNVSKIVDWALRPSRAANDAGLPICFTGNDV